MSGAVEFVSPYPVEECKRRLEAQMNAPWSVLALAEARPLIGRFHENSLRARRRIWFRNSFQTYLSAELSAEGGETRIRCRFSMHPLVRMFSVLWFSFVGLIGGFDLIVSLIDAVHRGVVRAWPGIAIFMLVLLFASVVTGFGRYFARNDRQFLTDFIEQTLSAQRNGA